MVTRQEALIAEELRMRESFRVHVKISYVDAATLPDGLVRANFDVMEVPKTPKTRAGIKPAARPAEPGDQKTKYNGRITNHPAPLPPDGPMPDDADFCSCPDHFYRASTQRYQHPDLPPYQCKHQMAAARFMKTNLTCWTRPITRPASRTHDSY